MKIKAMNWIVIMLLSLFGIIMGVLSIKGFTQKIEPVLWLLFGIVAALVLSKNIEQKVFLHGLLVGVIWGTLNGIVQSVFFETYLASNMAIKESFTKITFMKPRIFVLITGPVIGLFAGLIVGGLSLLLKKAG